MDKDSDILEREIITLIKDIASLSAIQSSCQKNVNEQLKYIREKLATKYDKSEAEKITNDIKRIMHILKMNNDDDIRRGIGFSIDFRKALVWGFLIISSGVGIVVGLLRLLSMIGVI